MFVISSRQDSSLSEEDDFSGIKLFRVYSNYHPRWRAYLSLYNFQTANRVNELIKEINPDVVYIHHVHHYLSYYCLKIAKKYCEKVFLIIHDVMPVHYGKWAPSSLKNLKITVFDQICEAQKRYNPLRNAIIRYFLKYVNKIFAVSNSLKQLLETNGIRNIETIYNGIDIKEWQLNKETIKEFRRKHNLKNKKIILFGGRLSELKGGEKIVHAMKRIVCKFPEAVLVVLGNKKGYGQEMQELAQKLGIRNNVVFVGWLSGHDLKSAYFNSNIYVFPSLCFEAFGLSCIEAMAAKKPVIASCFGGPSEIVVNKKTGYIVNPYDIEKMAEKIIHLLENPQKAKQFGEAGYERVKKYFSLDSQATETIAWYQKMLDDKEKELKKH